MITLAVIAALVLLGTAALAFAAGLVIGAKCSDDLKDAFDDLASWSKQATPESQPPRSI